MNSPLVSTAIHDGWIAVESGSIHLIVAAPEELSLIHISEPTRPY